MENYGRRLRCLVDKEDLHLYGNFDTNAADNLMVVFETCDPQKLGFAQRCKSDEEIRTWMQEKFILVLTNQK